MAVAVLNTDDEKLLPEDTERILSSSRQWRLGGGGGGGGERKPNKKKTKKNCRRLDCDWVSKMQTRENYHRSKIGKTRRDTPR